MIRVLIVDAHSAVREEFGYLPKDTAAELVCRAIKAAAAEQVQSSPQAFPYLIQVVQVPEDPPSQMGSETGHEQAEQELQQQAQQLRLQASLINLARDAIVVLDPASRIISWNRGAETLYGWTAQEAIGQVLHTLLQTGFPQSFETLHHLLEQEGQWGGDLTQTCRDGRQVIVESWWVLMRDERRSPLAILEIDRDITERRELERQKDILLAVVSHELKAPIANAKFSIYQLQEQVSQKGDEEVVTALGKIATQLDELRRLIDDILDATALEARMLPVYPAWFMIDNLVREIVVEFGSTHPTRHLFIEGEAHSQVYADRERTRQVLINLLSNAIKYSPQAQPVHVRAVASEDVVTVSVQDHGIGIPKEQQARIFERLVRLGGGKQAMAPGLGLGLYIAAELVKRQGGRIWVESTPGKGSTFSFTIPRHRPQGTRLAYEQEKKKHPAETPVSVARSSSGNR